MKNNHEPDEIQTSDPHRAVLTIAGLAAASLGAGSVLKTESHPQDLLASSSPSVPDVHTTSSDDTSSAASPYGFKYFVGIVGAPSDPDISWSDEELKQIKDLGVNMLQLSIAWGGKPAGEVLNLEDLDESQITKWKFRVSQAKKHGLSTMAQFGVPKLLYTANAYSIIQPACILDPEIREKYTRLLGDFCDKFPTVDNILLYTYDQNAWLCSEFGPCPRCSGIPLDERLSGFLDLMNEAIQKHRPGTTLWWKPWEISIGQAVKIVKKVNASNFGLVLNPSSANEVYSFDDRSFKSDLGIKRIVQAAADRGIPVIGEFDYTLYKDYYAINDYFPRFVYEQLQAWKKLNGVVGVKEYFGFAPSLFSVNADMLRACMKSPNASLDELLNEISAPYGEKAATFMMQAWERVAQGMEAFPWDTSPSIGSFGALKSDTGAHPWDPATIANATWSTPAWKTNRRA